VWPDGARYEGKLESDLKFKI
jgi:hypothetical protein